MTSMMGLTALGTVHAALAGFGIVVGWPQLLRRKGDAVHRLLGYAYAAAMLVADGSALMVFQFTGHLNVLHAGALLNLFCIAAGLRPALARPRRPGWVERHRVWMAGSYVGLLAAAATELLVRTVHLASTAQVWIATTVVTLLVWAVGRLLVPRRSGIAER